MFTGVITMLSNIKSSLLGILIVGCITYAGFYIYNLNRTISTLEKDKKDLNVKIANGIRDLAIKEAKVIILESSIKNLVEAIDKQNKEFENIIVDNEKLNQDILKLKHQEPSIKFINRTKVISCDDMNSLVKKIGELKYEDF